MGQRVPGAAKPNVRVRVRGRVVQIQRESTGIRTIGPSATSEEARPLRVAKRVGRAALLT